MKVIIKVTNCWSWLVTDNSDPNEAKYIKETLWKMLRFRARNYYHSRAYKMKIWDGYNEFFKKKNGQFLTGLLFEVKAVLDHLKIEYKIQDERIFPEFVVQQVTSDFLQQWNKSDKPFVLRDFQCDFPNQIIKEKRAIINAPTSSGKTEIMIAIMKTLREGTSILILANRVSLTEQNYNKIKEWGFQNVGRVYEKYLEPNIITCANVQSLSKIEKLIPYFRVLIVDEIHEMMSKVPIKYYNKMDLASIRVAISATPFKFDGKDKPQKYAVKGYFGPILRTNSIFSENGMLTTKKLQEKGTLSSSNVIFYTIKEPNLSLQIYQDAVTNGIASNPYFNQIVKKLVSTLQGRTLILVDRLEHGDALHGMIKNSLWVQGKDDLETRREVITQLQASENVVAIATQQIFNTGINVYIHNLINAAGGKAEHLIIQRMGRGLRTADDKEVLNYFDFIFEINEYLEKHSWQRVKILEKQEHNVIIKKEVDF